MTALSEFAATWAHCWLCDAQRDLEIHHICGRRGRDPHDPRNLFRICSHCHRLYHDGSRTERYIAIEHILYAKRSVDPSNYDPSYLAEIRGRKHLGVEPVMPDWWPYEIHFSVSLKPTPQPRPRFTMRGGFAKAYTDPKHAVHPFKKAIADAAMAAGAFPTTKPVCVSVMSIFSRPKSHLKNGVLKDTAPLVPPPDVDNLAKSVMDAMTEIAYADDKLVLRLDTEKRYSTTDRVIVKVQHAD